MNTGIIIDLALVVVFMVALIIGLVKGFNKLFMGFLAELGGLAIAGALCVVIANKLLSVPQIHAFADTIGTWFKKPNLNVEIGSLEELTTLLSTGVLRLLAGRSELLWSKMQLHSTNTLAGLYGHFILKAFTILICFIVVLILVRLVVNLICSLLQKLNKFTAWKIVNMLLGAVWTTVVAYILVVGVLLTGAELAISHWMADSIPVIQSALAESIILKILHNTNIIGQFISQSLAIPLPNLFPAV